MGAIAQVLRGTVISVFGALVIVAACEGGARVYDRIRYGRWTQTQAAQLYDAAYALTRIYRTHPFLNTAPRAGGQAEVNRKQLSFNSLGYRSPERPRDKPAGSFRIVCAGGSTTFDVLAPTDEGTWPWLLERELQRRGKHVEVWNAGFPGWTSLENTISLAIRDLDLTPDLVLLFQGINDLQPAAHQPFDPQYVAFHSTMSRRALGLSLTGPEREPLPLYARSIFTQKLLYLVSGPPQLLRPPPGEEPPPRQEQIPASAIRVFDRNVRSFIALAREHRAPTVLLTQTIRLRSDAIKQDTRYVERWIPGLAGDRANTELDRLNDVLRGLADRGDAALIDAAREVLWTDSDFGDPAHFAEAGSRKFAHFLADWLEQRQTVGG